MLTPNFDTRAAVRRRNMFAATNADVRADVPIGEVQNAVAMYFRVASSDPRVAQLASRLHADVTSLGLTHLQNNPSFQNLLHRYESEARGMGLDVDPAQRARMQLASANVSSADFAAALGTLARGPAGSMLRGNGDTRGDVRSGYGELRASAGDFTRDIGLVNTSNFERTHYAAAGLSYSTFADLRAQGFNGTNIIHAAQDATRYGFNPNDRRMVRNLAVLDQDDGARREERHRHIDRLRQRVDQDDQMKRLRVAREQATTDEERRRIDAQIHERGRQLQRETGMNGFINSSPTGRSRQANQELGDAAVLNAARAYRNDNNVRLQQADPADHRSRLTTRQRRVQTERETQIESVADLTVVQRTNRRSEQLRVADSLLEDTPGAPTASSPTVRQTATSPLAHQQQPTSAQHQAQAPQQPAVRSAPAAQPTRVAAAKPPTPKA